MKGRKKQENYTSQEIADRLGINRATVSKAFIGATDVSDELKAKIFACAAEIGYKPKPSGTLGVLWCKEGTPPSMEAVKTFTAAAEAANYRVLTFHLEKMVDLNAFFKENKLCGALMPDVVFNSSTYLQLHTIKYPVVLLDGYDGENPLISCVQSDNLYAVSDAVDYLVARGHKLIAFLGGPQNTLAGAERYAGYVLGLARNGLPYKFDLVYFGNFSEDSGEEAAQYYLSCIKYFTAIICASDDLAKGFMTHIGRGGRTVPDDISVIGFGDLRYENNLDGRLSRIVQNFDEVGKQAFAALKLTLGGAHGQRLKLKTLLDEGTTVCPVEPF